MAYTVNQWPGDWPSRSSRLLIRKFAIEWCLCCNITEWAFDRLLLWLLKVTFICPFVFDFLFLLQSYNGHVRCTIAGLKDEDDTTYLLFSLEHIHLQRLWSRTSTTYYRAASSSSSSSALYASNAIFIFDLTRLHAFSRKHEQKLLFVLCQCYIGSGL